MTSRSFIKALQTFSRSVNMRCWDFPVILKLPNYIYRYILQDAARLLRAAQHTLRAANFHEY